MGLKTLYVTLVFATFSLAGCSGDKYNLWNYESLQGLHQHIYGIDKQNNQLLKEVKKFENPSEIVTYINSKKNNMIYNGKELTQILKTACTKGILLSEDAEKSLELANKIELDYEGFKGIIQSLEDKDKIAFKREVIRTDSTYEDVIKQYFQGSIRDTNIFPYTVPFPEETINELVNANDWLNLYKSPENEINQRSDVWIRMKSELKEAVESGKPYTINPMRSIPYFGEGEKIDEYINQNSEDDSLEIICTLLSILGTGAGTFFGGREIQKKLKNSKNRKKKLATAKFSKELKNINIWGLESDDKESN